MNKYFTSNIKLSFEKMLETLEISESDYIYAIRSTLKRNKIFLKRKTDEIAINAYNPIILILIQSNMDLQNVLDAYVAVFCMVNYVTKIEAGLSIILKEASDDIENGNLDLKQKFRKIANTFINGNVLTAQEAVYHALSLPLCISSRNVVYINTVPNDQRSRILKRSKDLKQLPENSKDMQVTYLKNMRKGVKN